MKSVSPDRGPGPFFLGRKFSSFASINFLHSLGLPSSLFYYLLAYLECRVLIATAQPCLITPFVPIDRSRKFHACRSTTPDASTLGFSTTTHAFQLMIGPPRNLNGFVVWMHKAASKRIHIIGELAMSGCITDGLQPRVKMAVQIVNPSLIPISCYRAAQNPTPAVAKFFDPTLFKLL